MKAENGSVPVISDSLPFIGHAEGMSRIINHLQIMLLRNRSDFFNVAYIPVDMNRKDCAGPVCDQLLYPVRIHGIIVFSDITEDRRKTVSHNRMGR